MRRLRHVIALAVLLGPGAAQADCDIDAAVQAWADDWSAQDAIFLQDDVAFELRVTDTRQVFRVELPKQGHGRVQPSQGSDYALLLGAEHEVFCDLASGTMNVLTTLGQAVPTDPTPLHIATGDTSDKESPFRGERGALLTLFHFFNTGTPEVVKFGFGHGRQVHGGHAVPLYYGKGLRMAWYGLKPGMHINKNPRDQVNEFDSIFVILAGEVHAKFDGKHAVFHRGESIFVPTGMSHELWVEDGAGEFLVIMMGEGA